MLSKWQALLVLSVLAVAVQGVFIHKEILSSTQFCLSDDIPRHTMVQIDIKSQGNFTFQFKEGMLPVSAFNLTTIAFTKSVTTQRYGIHFFCFLNTGRTAKIAFQISIGHRAKDYGSPVGGDDLVGALSNQGRIAEEFIGEIVKENTEGLEIIVKESRQTHDFGQYMFFSIVFCLSSILMTYLQYRVIKKHLHSRKYI